MKKISAVLLVLVLVGSVAFAGFTGEAEVNFGVNLATGEYGFDNPTAWDLDLVFHQELGAAKGEGDIYAEIAASFTFSYERDEADGLDIVAGDFEVDFDYAKIVGDNWYVSVLGAMAAPNFASSAIDTDNTADEDALDLDPSDFVSNGEVGIEVMYADYTFGLSVPYGGADNNFKNGLFSLFGSVTTPDFELADGLTLAFGAAGLLEDNNKAVSASAKGTYTMEEVTASVAADVAYDNTLKAEVAVNAVIDPVTLDVYYATEDDAATSAYTATTHILSVKAAFAVDKFDIEVTGKDLVNSQALGASVDFAATEEISVNVNGGYTLSSGAWYAGAGATYTAEKYVASADATYASAGTVEVNASVESTALVAGATLSLGYETADILTDAGKITAAVNIAF